MGAYQNTIKRLGHTRAFRAMFKHTLPRIDRVINRVSGGRLTFGSSVVPTFVVVHTGRTSGKQYRTPLSFVRLDNGYAIAGSNWGQAKHPTWSGNLIANPDVVVIDGGKQVPVHARLALGAEREQLWPRFVEMWPAYDTYKQRAGDRNIRVFVLEPR
jgi:deazaflavin-dependent oxidoreductase (nitroreductase family)